MAVPLKNSLVIYVSFSLEIVNIRYPIDKSRLKIGNLSSIQFYIHEKGDWLIVHNYVHRLPSAHDNFINIHSVTHNPYFHYINNFSVSICKSCHMAFLKIIYEDCYDFICHFIVLAYFSYLCGSTFGHVAFTHFMSFITSFLCIIFLINVDLIKFRMCCFLIQRYMRNCNLPQ